MNEIMVWNRLIHHGWFGHDNFDMVWPALGGSGFHCDKSNAGFVHVYRCLCAHAYNITPTHHPTHTNSPNFPRQTLFGKESWMRKNQFVGGV